MVNPLSGAFKRAYFYSMRKRWWYDPAVWLMSFSMFLIVLFAFFWLRNTYRSHADDLTQEISFIFRDVVRGIEDSLMWEGLRNRDLFPLTDSIHHIVVRLREDSVADFSLQTRLNDNISMEGPGSDHLMIGPKDGTAGVLTMQWKMLHQDTQVHVWNQDTIVPEILKIISKGTSQAMSTEKLSTAYEVVRYDSLTPQRKDAIFSRPYFDLAAQQYYALAVDESSPIILKRMTNEIIFTIILIFSTLLAFYVTYSSLVKQKRLALLKNDLISNITHELKTPIATVSVAIEALRNFNADADPQKVQEYLEISNNEINRLSLLVDNVLKTSVDEGKIMALEMEMLDMQQLITDILQTMQLQFEKFGATVKKNIVGQERGFLIRGDRMHMTSVLYNLLDNALKYGGSAPEISIQLHSDYENTIIEVTDKGPGIPLSEQSKIFEKFYRVPSENIHNVKGHGLGLNYVQKVVEKHGGSINVSSSMEGGSRFIVKLPQNNDL